MQVGFLRWVAERHPWGRPVGGRVRCGTGPGSCLVRGRGGREQKSHGFCAWEDSSYLIVSPKGLATSTITLFDY